MNIPKRTQVSLVSLLLLGGGALAGTIQVPDEMRGIAYGPEAQFASMGMGVQSHDPLDNWHLVNPVVEGGNVIAVAVGNGLIAALVDTGTNYARIVVSKDGYDWYTKASPYPAKPFALLFVPNDPTKPQGAGRFVAVGRAMIAYSDDGESWSQPYAGGLDDIYDVTVGKDPATGKNIFVATGVAGKIMFSEQTDSSPGGDLWTAVPVDDTSQPLYGVAYGNGTFVAVGDKCKIRTSVNGKTWGTGTPPACLSTSDKLKGIAFGNGRFVVATDKDRIYTSTDGVHWKRVFTALAHNINRIKFLNGRFIAIGNYGTILSSADGLRWTVENVKDLENPILTDLTLLLDGKTYLAVGKGIIMKSTDLRAPQWDSWTLQARYLLGGVAFGAGGFAAAGDNLSIFRSTAGDLWSSRVYSGTSAYHFKGITFGQGRFVAVGGSSTENLIITSEDGVTWTEVDFGSCAPPGCTRLAQMLNGVTFGADTFVAVGDKGTVLTSRDAVLWAMQPSLGDTAVSLKALAYGANRFVAVGSSGKGFTSSDGIGWQVMTNPFGSTSVTGTGVAFGGSPGTFVAVVNGTSAGKVFTSPDGSTWTEVKPYPAAPPLFYGVHWDTRTGNFFALGAKATVWSSPDGFLWEERVSDPDFFASADRGTGTANIRSIAYGNNQLVAVGDVGASYAKAGLILKSDPLVPPAPARLVATSTTAKAIHLTWGDETNEESFRLYRRKGSAAWTQIATLPADTTAYTDDKAQGNSAAPNAYSYHLIACNNLNGELNSSCSAPSETVVTPYLPTGLKATPGARQITLQWTDVANDTGYEIHRKPGACAAPGAYVLVGTAEKDAVAFTDTGLKVRTAYSYKIRALTKGTASAVLGYSRFTACMSAKTP